ncbi:DUF5691 domain-containing protein [Dyadobacter sp. NIV53]|uniref:DUF5691 domain-containing protein n=1 Tax=Dyadobacter sp. NIV53 TaxID=2861765 RepID=UPI001C868538|nr:DUF5691 domain-containing protein [Dyadobacter sp. NIV53]
MIANEILKAGLLGTDKYMPGSIAPLKEVQEKLESHNSGKEDRFLKLAAIALLYEECGRLPEKADLNLPVCPEETAVLISNSVASIMESVLINKQEVLFQYLIFICNCKKQVLSPELVPIVLNKALEHKKTARPLVDSCGKLGKWLCQLNPEWAILLDESVEGDIWNTGNHESRKSFLTILRENNPAEALLLLQETISEENAVNRLSFLEVLTISLSIQDEPFLQGLARDKSQKVKDAAMGFLRMIPGSAINKMYLDFLSKAIHFKEERHLLIYKKKVLYIDETIIADGEIFKTGISRLSSEKGVNDQVYVIGQLLANMDPIILEEKFQISEQDLLSALLAHKEVKTLIPFIGKAAVSFKNKNWAIALLQTKSIRDIGLLNVLSEDERQGFYEQFLDHDIQPVLNVMLNNMDTPIMPAIAEKLLTHLSRNPYNITQPVYQLLALHLPQGFLNKLQALLKGTEQDYQSRYFRSQVSEMISIIETKTLIHT